MSAISPKPPGSTPQNVKTPKIFIDAARQKFGNYTIDLAASESNICDIYFDKNDNSLEMDWRDLYRDVGDLYWLNPPFGLSSKFIKKCSDMISSIDEHDVPLNVDVLVQAATSSNYWYENVFGNKYCDIIFLNGRIPFEGYDNSANIDCTLLKFSSWKRHQSMYVWDWRNHGSEIIPVGKDKRCTCGDCGCHSFLDSGASCHCKHYETNGFLCHKCFENCVPF